MKPVTSTTDLATLLDNASILMLKSYPEGIRYITQVLASISRTITSKGAISLPNELWNRIISLAISNTEPAFCFVQITSTNGNYINCREISDDGWPFCGELASSSDIELFEEFLDTPNTTSTSKLDIPPIKPRWKSPNKFEVLISPSDDESRDKAILFHDIKVPDVIAFIENGDCGFCRKVGLKFFYCPGCTGGQAQAYDMFMGCGVDLVCPVCIGLDVAREHKVFLQTHYGGSPPEDEQEEMDTVLKARFDELGYEVEFPWNASAYEFE